MYTIGDTGYSCRENSFEVVDQKVTRKRNLVSDADECVLGNGGCAQVCINTEGSFRCDCTPGYTMATNGLDCVGEKFHS